MKKSYKKQILDYNIKKFSLIVRYNINIICSTKTLTEIDKNIILQVNSISDIKKIIKYLKWHVKKDNNIKLEYN